MTWRRLLVARCLYQFPVETLKLDRSFVTAINGFTKRGGDVIVRSTVALAHSVGFRVMAERIEPAMRLRVVPGLARLRAGGAEETYALLSNWMPERALRRRRS